MHICTDMCFHAHIYERRGNDERARRKSRGASVLPSSGKLRTGKYSLLTLLNMRSGHMCRHIQQSTVGVDSLVVSAFLLLMSMSGILHDSKVLKEKKKKNKQRHLRQK